MKAKVVRKPRPNASGKIDNRKWEFTPAHWARWLARRAEEPDERLVQGIAEFRSLLENK